MLLLILFENIPIGNGFGFNTNILETNIINLTVVVALVFIFVGDALKSLLENRKQTVLNNLQEADKKAAEIQEKFNKAQSQLELAKDKAINIRKQGFATAEREKLQTLSKVESESIRLEELKNERINRQQQKIFSKILEQVILLAVTKVRERTIKSANEIFHFSFNRFGVIEMKKSLEDFYQFDEFED